MTTVDSTDLERTASPAHPDRSELVARATALQPLVRRHAGEMDTQRRLADEVNAALVDAGMFQLMKPRQFGGYDASLRTVVEVVATLGEADGSTAWLVGIGTGTDWMLGRLSSVTQDAILGADPGARLAGSLTPGMARRVEGGVRMNGRWANASGAHHATWASIAATVVGDDGDVLDVVMGYVPVSELTPEDTWHTAGMRGTSSNTFVGEDVFVPDHMLASMSTLAGGGMPPGAGTIHRLPLSAVATLMLLAPIVGIGRAAMDLTIAAAGRKGISQTTYTRQTDSVGVQIQVAEAAVKLATAQLHLYGIADDMDSAAAGGEQIGYEVRAQARARAGYAAQQVLEAIQMLVDVHGAGSFAEASRMQHHWRDANTAARHGGLNRSVGYEIYGKSLLGVEERISQVM